MLVAQFKELALENESLRNNTSKTINKALEEESNLNAVKSILAKNLENDKLKSLGLHVCIPGRIIELNINYYSLL